MKHSSSRGSTLTAIDLFAGAGGATQGLRNAGFNVVAAVENDVDASASYRLNHPTARLFENDIRRVPAVDLLRNLGLAQGELTLLKACPPCQGFSSLRGGRAVDESRNDLVLDISRFVRVLRPRSVLLENVPGLSRDGRFEELKARIEKMGYTWQSQKIDAASLGTPQRRKRLVAIAIRSRRESRFDLLDLIPESSRRAPMTAGAMLATLNPRILANDPVHTWRQSSPKVLKRIAAIPQGGNRFDLPEELQLDCHRKADRGSRVATASYGRIHIDRVAPTMTTRCTTPACGSFIHPIENRGISLREAAAFQTFPASYQFAGTYSSIERQIGNAVPVWMAQALGLAARTLLDE